VSPLPEAGAFGLRLAFSLGARRASPARAGRFLAGKGKSAAVESATR